ncbi:MAG: hypothetical protein QOF33_2309 [Thermomicrobiales bacterium]|jgi:hypothetical protein|nr:hypothetical protein [Thermomicrobiales bacterium]
MSTRNAGTRSRYYQRSRPSGEAIHDIEASLAYVEDKATQPLKQLISGEPVTVERKGGVAQLLALQMLRGPAFFEQREEILAPMLEELQASDFKPAAIAAAGGDVAKVRRRLLSAYLDPTQRFMTMLATGVKMASVLSLMRWQILRFDEPVLAYSDHPVVLWPMSLERSAPFTRQGLGPLGAFEIRVPIAPDAAILMTWVDLSDQEDIRLSARAAGELNAFTVSQSERQWMHRPGAEPPVPRGVFAPLSRMLAPTYDRRSALGSARRAAAQRFIARVEDRRHVDDVEVIVDLPALLTPAA